ECRAAGSGWDTGRRLGRQPRRRLGARRRAGCACARRSRRPRQPSLRHADAPDAAVRRGRHSGRGGRLPTAFEASRRRRAGRAAELEDERISRVFAVSCATGAGIEEFRRALFELVPEPEERAADDALADFLVYRPAAGSRSFKILRTDRGFRITGHAPEDDELEAALRAAGAKTGDEVEVEGEVLELD